MSEQEGALWGSAGAQRSRWEPEMAFLRLGWSCPYCLSASIANSVQTPSCRGNGQPCDSLEDQLLPELTDRHRRRVVVAPTRECWKQGTDSTATAAVLTERNIAGRWFSSPEGFIHSILDSIVSPMGSA